uniref:WPK1 n=1 Tax=Arundo donax TaxID=35708 RepID=A0A0A8YDX2_ARUDO
MASAAPVVAMMARELPLASPHSSDRTPHSPHGCAGLLRRTSNSS